MVNRKADAVHIPDELHKLDKIMDTCRWRFSNHYAVGQWEKLSKDIGGSDQANPLWKAYIKYLYEEAFIEVADPTQGSGDGYIATMRGQLHKGFVKTLIDEANEIRLQRKREIRLTLISGGIGTILGALIGLGTPYLQKQLESPKSDALKIQIVHDTVYLNLTSLTPDTALVRLVKRKRKTS